MVEFVLTHGCSICPRLFTTRGFAGWHLKRHHKRLDAIPKRLKEPINVDLERGPKMIGVSVADCPRHRKISVGIKARHNCYSPMFACKEGCIFCKKCNMFSSQMTTKTVFPGNIMRHWKRATPKSKIELAEA